MKIAFYGSSLLSSYWNGAATYYRGLIKALSALGHEVTFYEPDVYDRGKHRDIEPPDWCDVVVYDGTTAAVRQVTRHAAAADIVIKASGIGYEDDAILAQVMDAAHPHALRIFWDVDAPATLAELHAAPDHPLRTVLPHLDAVLTYGGGAPVISAYRSLGARCCQPIYNALDPDTHHPVAASPAYLSDLGFLGNRLPDREARVDDFFFAAANLCPSKRFTLGGSGWADKPRSSNVDYVGHVGTQHHNAFNVSPRAVLNISRDGMAAMGFSPATRVFEAAGAGACLITDEWPGIDTFFTPGSEILIARDGGDVVALLDSLTTAAARMIGQAAMTRARAEHTYVNRARDADAVFTSLLERRRERLR